MLTGHVAIAMGAHGLRSTVPLWLLILATQLPDWADAALCTAGMRSTVPGAYSHGFIPIGVLAVAASIAWFARSKSAAGSLMIGAVVISHALGDYVTGTKPTWPGGPMVGMQLYSQPALDFLFESVVIVGCWLLYRRSIPLEKRGSRFVMILLFTLLLIQGAADILLSLSPGLKKC